MSEEQKLIAELAARFMVEVLRKVGPTRDNAYAHQCVSHATIIVNAAAGAKIGAKP